MTKKEFLNNKEPLVLIVSFDPRNGKSIYDTYEEETGDAWMKDFEKDFPNLIHFKRTNKAGIESRKGRIFDGVFGERSNEAT